jgi:hypothetical protein
MNAWQKQQKLRTDGWEVLCVIADDASNVDLPDCKPGSMTPRAYKAACKRNTKARIMRERGLSADEVEVVLEPSWGYCYNAVVFVKPGRGRSE